MIGFVLWLIVLGYPALYVFALVANKTWKARALWWALLSVPLIAHFWDYPVVYHQHKTDCEADGGLKVFIRPEKADTIFAADRNIAASVLDAYFPAIKSVVASDGSTTGGVRNYFVYTVDPATAKNVTTRGRSRGFKLIKTPGTPMDKDIYTLRHVQEGRPHGSSDRYLLERNGTVYAQWTSYQTTWNSGGILPTSWQCFTINQTGRIGEANLVDLLVE